MPQNATWVLPADELDNSDDEKRRVQTNPPLAWLAGLLLCSRLVCPVVQGSIPGSRLLDTALTGECCSCCAAGMLVAASSRVADQPGVGCRAAPGVSFGALSASATCGCATWQLQARPAASPSWPTVRLRWRTGVLLTPKPLDHEGHC